MQQAADLVVGRRDAHAREPEALTKSVQRTP
jgi:hypothetical protein